jgi:hypothetical protein
MSRAIDAMPTTPRSVTTVNVLAPPSKANFAAVGTMAIATPESSTSKTPSSRCLTGRPLNVSGPPDVGDPHRVVKPWPSARPASQSLAPYRRRNRRHRPFPWLDYLPQRHAPSGGFRSSNRLSLVQQHAEHVD